ncbi:hypothetical protein DQ04_04841040 [Trypanosoma grayi]|uniref:hypothetical protein n=1 Tax=Trypanosoma grayi TaxID=71804 RepID=UPI0004F4994B|nr:hypothetical protein DQ04_04841040 [Trypanosoma grayi]KEG09668.1 hypothetical protein DQ04_04841040 [Trypanosoma grayi]
MASRGILGAVGAVSVFGVTGVVMLGSRWRQLESRRAKLNNEYADILEELRALEDSRLQDAVKLRQKRQETAQLHETVDAVWAERLARYTQTNKELHSYLAALPEALGALKGLTNHYQYMMLEMRKFIAFDVACSKVHNLALLLEHGDHVGIQRVAQTIQQLLVAEPLVQVVCDNITDATADISSPNSLGDCSASFVFCMEELDRAIEGAVERYAEYQRDHAEKAPNAVCEGLRKLGSEVKVSTLSKGDIMMQKERKVLRDLLLRDRRQLHTTEDLTSAVRHAENVSERLHNTNTHDGGLQATVAADSAVENAQEQLLLWRRSAVVFLLRQQAKDALGAYHLLLAETLTKTKSA